MCTLNLCFRRADPYNEILYTLDRDSTTTVIESAHTNTEPFETVFDNADEYEFFEIDASDFERDANIGLSTKPVDPNSPVDYPVDYHILLGGWGGRALLSFET